MGIVYRFPCSLTRSVLFSHHTTIHTKENNLDEHIQSILQDQVLLVWETFGLYFDVYILYFCISSP